MCQCSVTRALPRDSTGRHGHLPKARSLASPEAFLQGGALKMSACRRISRAGLEDGDDVRRSRAGEGPLVRPGDSGDSALGWVPAHLCCPRRC